MNAADLAGWVASGAVMMAAIMTASNLGARITGWGFVLFAVGSLAWTINAAMAGETSLLIANAVLLVVNLFGVWRWLGRQAKYADASDAAEKRSRHAASPDLIALSRLSDMPLFDQGGQRIGRLVEAMALRGTGETAYFVIAIGGIGGVGEALYGVRARQLRFDTALNAVLTGVTHPEQELPRLDDDWPSELPESPD